MTVKRRLFWVNIIMILSPFIITGIVFMGVRAVVVDPYDQTRGGPGGRFPDMPAIPVVGLSEADEAFARGDFVRVAGDAALYHSDLGDYIIIVSDTHREAIEAFHMGPALAWPYLVFATLFLVVLANLLIAKYISRRITGSINILASGVGEISSGNLAHRIEYKGDDEFDAVCADFNEMASRLSDMVEQRQVDEKNRRELIAGISHDLRTPLTSVSAYIEGLRKGIATTPEMQEKHLDTIQRKREKQKI